jgi:hypothetical protein
MTHSTEYWGETIPPDQVVNPIVYQFRPNRYVQVDDAHRAQFEEYFRENIGFPPPPAAGSQGVRPEQSAPWPNGGISGSNNDWDD